MRRFTLGLNIAKNIDQIHRESVSKKNCISYKKVSEWTHISVIPRSGARGLRKLSFLKYYNVLEV